jgi:hypothetical protein
MMASQSDSIGRLSPRPPADSVAGRPLSCRSLIAGVMVPENTRGRVVVAGGQVDPLLNMA